MFSVLQRCILIVLPAQVPSCTNFAQGLTKLYLDFEKTKGKLETVLDKYQMKMEHHKKIKKRDTVCHLFCRPLVVYARQSSK